LFSIQVTVSFWDCGIWKEERRKKKRKKEKKKKLSPDVQLEKTRIVQLLYTPSTTTKNEQEEKIYKVRRCTILFEAMTVCGSQLVRHFPGSAQV
jgi:hypothetical protein